MSSRRPAAPRQRWYTLSPEEAMNRLRTNRLGLTPEEAAERLGRYGFNEIEETTHNSAFGLFASQFKNVLILILLLATGVSAYLGHGVEASVIAVIVLFAVTLGFVQEYRAERALEALREMAAPTATVIRDGSDSEIPARHLVPGDIVLLRTGDRVPADLRLLESINLKADEAPLTGESAPVEKQRDALIYERVPLGDRSNMVFAGTVVTYGRGMGLVVETGMQTEFGRIVGLIRDTAPRQTPLQRNLDKAGNLLALTGFLLVTVIVIIGIFRGESFLQMLIFGIALAVAVVPEALPAVVTISLAIGARKMVKRNALIRRLPTVETLGCTSVICSDKTGTLTRGEMTARRIWTAGRSIEVTGTGFEPFGRFLADGEAVTPTSVELTLLNAAVLSSDAQLVSGEGQRWRIKGDPTEGALIVAAAKAGLKKDALERRFPRLAEIPFTSETKRMITLHQVDEARTAAYAKGAVEMIIGGCSQWLTELGEMPLEDAHRAEILLQAQAMASQALRVLAIAQKRNVQIHETGYDMTFLGLVGMIDPPRPESRGSIETCGVAGIRVIMITGDHPLTAGAVAREIGILKNGRIVTGDELTTMSQDQLEREIDTIDVYARVSPEHKLRVVAALQRQGHVVAMTGDGVNDAPALKQADIGIAMGLTGTDVSKEAATMTLTDDNFASIVAAVEEGRAIFSNIKKYLMYLLAANIGEIGLMGAAALLGLPLPLSAVQILYINLATDGLPALALAVDPNDEGLMRQKPRDPRAGIFSGPVVALMLAGGFWSAAAHLALFAWLLAQGQSMATATTMVFVSLEMTELFKAYCYRSETRSVFRRTFTNHWLNLAIFWEVALLLALVYLPLLQQLFGTVALNEYQWLMTGAVSLSVVPVLELFKLPIRRGWFGIGGIRNGGRKLCR